MNDLDLFLLRYGEIGTKSPRIRKHFEDILIQNVERTFLSKKKEVILEKRGRGRIFAYARKESSYLFSRIFGLVSYSPAKEVGADLADLKKEGRKFAEGKSGSFAVRARRVGDQDYTSQDIESLVGEVILNENPNLEVNLDDPDEEFYVEIRHSRSYVFTEIEEGPGGLPLSCQGKVATYVETKKDFIATWLMMKRGARPYVYHPGSKWAEKLERWDPNLKKIEVMDMEDMLSQNFPDQIKGIVLGQTLDNYYDIGKEYLVLRPLIGLTKNMIEQIYTKVKRLESKEKI